MTIISFNLNIRSTNKAKIIQGNEKTDHWIMIVVEERKSVYSII